MERHHDVEASGEATPLLANATASSASAPATCIFGHYEATDDGSSTERSAFPRIHTTGGAIHENPRARSRGEHIADVFHRFRKGIITNVAGVHENKVEDAMTYYTGDLGCWSSLFAVSMTIYSRRSLWITGLRLFAFSTFVALSVVFICRDPSSLKVHRFTKSVNFFIFSWACCWVSSCPRL